jgi:hypothetical protein
MSETINIIKLTNRSLKSETFIKLVLDRPTGSTDINKVVARLVRIKGEDMLSIVSSFKTNDITKNYSLTTGVEALRRHVDASFNNVALFTTEADYRLKKGMAGKEKIVESPPTITNAPGKSHDHSKNRLVAQERPFLAALGLTNSDGEIKSKMNGKYNQVESFINILSSTINASSLKEKQNISFYDMGAGSAYVSFAVYDYVTKVLQKETKLTGVDTFDKLVTRNNLLARELDFSGINFITSPINELGPIQTDVVIALHACNTATDDALFAGINAGAELIIVSPCCHQELRKSMLVPEVLKPMLKFGTQKEQMAEMLTDTIRTLLLEINGYKTNLFEFVSDEHSGKNNIIVAVKKQSNQNKNTYITQLAEIKEFYGISEDLYFESLFQK